MNPSATDSYFVLIDIAPGFTGPLTLHAHVSSNTLDEVPTNNDLDKSVLYVGDPSADGAVSIAYLPGTTGVGALNVKLTNHGPNLLSAEPFTIHLSSTFTSASLWSADRLACTVPAAAPGGGLTITCSADGPLPPGTFTVKLFAQHGADPAEIVASIAPANDPNPANNVAVWSSGTAPALSGTVTEAGTTKVLPGITVTLIGPGPTWNVVATTTTDALGHYRFDGLDDGSYRVRFFDAAGVYERAWWPSQISRVAAVAIQVVGGTSSLANQNMTPAEGRALRGRAQTKAGVGLAGIHVLVFDVAKGFVGATVTGPNGYYELRALTASDYYVQFVDPSHTYLSRWSGDVLRFADAKTVNVSSGPTWSSVILR
jgi:hypothetical protein